jgi:hypothetical protein
LEEAMTDSSEDKSCDMFSSLMRGGIFQQMVSRQAEGLLKAQTGMFQTMASIVEAWTANRRDAASAALQAFQRMSASEDMGKMMAVYSEWLSETAKRLNDEAAALGKQAASMNQAAMAAVKEASQSMQPAADEGEQATAAESSDPRKSWPSQAAD